MQEMFPEPESSSLLRRYAFHLMVGTFVLVVSFAYGFSAGLKKNSGLAHAGFQGWELAGDASDGMTRMPLPDGVTALPLGQEITLNNKAAEVVSFVSDRSAVELVNEQMAAWKAAGIKVLGTAGARRGFVIGFNPAIRERYSFTAWSVPPALRNSVSGGKPVQGTMIVADAGKGTEPNEGLVPDVPLMPGGKGGSVFSALDPGGRSYSGIYTHPGTVADSVDFFESELPNYGWRKEESDIGNVEKSRFEVGHLLFRRAGEEAIIMLSPSSDIAADDGETAKTVVSVSRGPLGIENWRQPR